MPHKCPTNAQSNAGHAKSMINQCGRGKYVLIIDVGNGNNMIIIYHSSPASPLPLPHIE
jgi:hypothetical protein